MKLKSFKYLMQKGVFSWEEAKIMAFGTTPAVLKLELHKWTKSGDIISIRRGIYAFSDSKPLIQEISVALCQPCYISTDSALNFYGLLPDVVFGTTLVTTKTTRKFNTPFGQFSYQKIKKETFFGFDTKTLMAEREKAVVDYLYLNRNSFSADAGFWAELRWQNLNELNFKKAFFFAEKFRVKKLDILLRSLKDYAKLDKTG